MKMTLLDQILQMIIDYIKLLGVYPEVFEYQESQEKEFNRWKQQILEYISFILHQVNVSLNILQRKNVSVSQQIEY